MRIYTLRQLRNEKPWGVLPLVTTNGCFDLLHVGHLRVIEYAKTIEPGGWLLVLVNSDASIQSIKGPDRPFICEAHRSRLVAALRAVDGVLVFKGQTPCEVLRQLPVSVHVKGGDWRREDLPETKIIEANGGRVEILAREDGPSTTDIAIRVMNGPAR